MIELRDVSFAHPGRSVFSGLDLIVPDGSRITVLGRSGSGKTTLLHLLSGLAVPDRGEALMDGGPISGGNGRLAVILQDFGLFPWLNAEGNAGLGLRLGGIRGTPLRSAARSALSSVGLGGLEGRYPRQLSGGQKQRLAIARALAMDASHLMMDEPLGALDAFTREELQGLILRLCMEKGLTMVMVTHDVSEAVYLGDEILVLDGRGGYASAKGIVAAGHGFSGDGPDRNSPEFNGKVAEVRALLGQPVI